MVLLAELVPRLDVIMEESAVINDAGDDLDVMLLRGGQRKATRPRLQGIKDDHRPIEQRPEALEAQDQVERETVRRSGRNAEAVGEPGVLELLHRLPDRVA